MKRAKAGVSVIYGGVPREMAWHLFKKKKNSNIKQQYFFLKTLTPDHPFLYLQDKYPSMSCGLSRAAQYRQTDTLYWPSPHSLDIYLLIIEFQNDVNRLEDSKSDTNNKCNHTSHIMFSVC